MTSSSDAVLPKPRGIARIVYKEIVTGDRRKFEAQSNDSPSGGGARDLRFRPYTQFGPIFEKLFPNRDEDGVSCGYFKWMVGEKENTGEAFFHPPTTARPNEGRLANVDKYLPTDTLPAEGEDTTILLIIQRDDKTVWPVFTTDRSLASGRWHATVSEPILACLRAYRRAGIATCGFLDYETSEVFCNGR